VREPAASTLLALDCDPAPASGSCSLYGRLVRIDPSSGALTVLKTGFNFQDHLGGLAIEPPAGGAAVSSVLVSDCGPTSGSCTAGSRLLRVPLDGNPGNLGTVVLSGRNALGAVAVEAGDATALVVEDGTGKLLRATFATRSSSLVGSGLAQLSPVVIEAGGATALVWAAGGLARMTLPNDGSGAATLVVPVQRAAFALEPGGATALLAGGPYSSVQGGLLRVNLATGALDALNPTPDLFGTYDGSNWQESIALSADGSTMYVSEAHSASIHGRGIGMLLALPVP
jgi:hypothetical protein